MKPETRPEPRPVMPQVRAFLLCREVFEDGRRSEYLLVAPTTRIEAPQFPHVMKQELYVEIASGRGEYRPTLQVRNDQDEVIWGQPYGAPFRATDPLTTHQIAFRNLAFCLMRPGRYDLVLLLNDQEAARRPFFVVAPAPPT
jgi:hypothetical protein